MTYIRQWQEPQEPKMLKRKINWKNYEFHELSNIIPVPLPEDYENLKSSIQNLGFKSEFGVIWLLDGKIIQGRQRYKACLELNIEPKFKEFSEEYPDKVKDNKFITKWIWALDTARRHLSEADKYTIMRRLQDRGWTQKEIAEELKASLVSVKRYFKVLKDAPELASKVESGELKVTTAFKETELKNRLGQADIPERKIAIESSNCQKYQRN
jgi:ParB-like chromosome segregation protein Spo0J